MKRRATAVDASATLTYHSFPMSPPLPHPRARVLLSLGCLALCCLATLAAPLGCATSDDATKPVTYSLTAKQNYEKGLAELKDENYPEAQKYFQFVKQKYPFSKYAVLAELAVADSHFARGNYSEAIDSYKTFARLHPTHEKVEDGYVAFRIGESYFKDMPDDIWLLPPSYEKDQSAVTDALRELGDFAKKFPDSTYLKQAEDLRRQVLQRLVDHEVYVARFYLAAITPRRPRCASRARCAATRARGASPSCSSRSARPSSRWAIRCAPRRRSSASSRVRRGAEDARRAALYLQFIAKRYGDNPKPLAPRAGPSSAVPADAHG